VPDTEQREGLSVETFVLEATYEDLSVRVLASLDVARERARDLTAQGWEVEIRDEAGRLFDPSAEPATSPAPEPAATGTLEILTGDDDFPAPPPDLDPTVLRETG
jgi:hypothetical protein